MLYTYYKEVINHNLGDLKYLLIVGEKINIAKIRTNSHELHNEKGCWSIPKNPWVKRIFHLSESMSIEDEKHFLFTLTLELNFRLFATIQTFITS